VTTRAKPGSMRGGKWQELTTPPARATSLLARADLEAEAAKRRGLAAARGSETECGAGEAARRLAAAVGAEETAAAAKV
jgi:hypothetical protein